MSRRHDSPAPAPAPPALLPVLPSPARDREQALLDACCAGARHDAAQRQRPANALQASVFMAAAGVLRDTESASILYDNGQHWLQANGQERIGVRELLGHDWMPDLPRLALMLNAQLEAQRRDARLMRLKQEE